MSEGGIKQTNLTNDSLGGPAAPGDVTTTTLSTCNAGRLARAYANGPQWQSTPKSNLFGEQYNLTKSGYRTLYREQVLDGNNEFFVAKFGDTPVEMDYDQNSPPKIGDPDNPVTPTDGPAAGTLNSTIAKSGLGPNVSTHGTMVDATPAEIRSDVYLAKQFTRHNPAIHSADIASGGVHGGAIKGEHALKPLPADEESGEGES